MAENQGCSALPALEKRRSERVMTPKPLVFKRFQAVNAYKMREKDNSRRTRQPDGRGSRDFAAILRSRGPRPGIRFQALLIAPPPPVQRLAPRTGPASDAVSACSAPSPGTSAAGW